MKKRLFKTLRRALVTRPARGTQTLVPQIVNKIKAKKEAANKLKKIGDKEGTSNCNEEDTEEVKQLIKDAQDGKLLVKLEGLPPGIVRRAVTKNIFPDGSVEWTAVLLPTPNYRPVLI